MTTAIWFIMLATITAFALAGWLVMEHAYLAERRAHAQTRGALRIAYAAMLDAQAVLVDGDRTPVFDALAEEWSL